MRLERWLGVLSSPAMMLDHWTTVPSLARLAVSLLGASHHIADVLVQNPETGAILTDAAELTAPKSRESLGHEAARLLANSVSYAHRLDRLRFLKQRETLRLAALDLGRLVPEQVVWTGISDLADAIVRALRQVVWDNYREGKGLVGGCPFSVVAFGKLGGRELNYSSDIDLVFVLDGDLNEEDARHASKACELFRAALADKMGRGALYRVDLRLRPFGSQGPIASPIEVYRSYYEKYAETWEHLALLRSRVVAGTEGLDETWDAMRAEVVFRSVRSDMALESLVSMRSRVEDVGSDNDLKRGRGGIRDIEFLVQTMQMVFGATCGACRERATVPAIGALCEAGYLSPDAAAPLAEAYVFLRQAEHRCQIVGNLQTHEAPDDPVALAALSHAMGYGDPDSFLAELRGHRGRVRSLYESLMPGGGPKVVEAKRDPIVRHWIDGLPASEDVWRSLTENHDSLGRVVRLAQDAPELARMLSSSPAVSEAVISGEVLEEPVTPDLSGLRSRPPSSRGVVAAMDAWLAGVARWCLGAGPSLGQALSARDDHVLTELAHGTGLDVIALGSLASRDSVVFSDIDIVLMCADDHDWADAERAGQDLLASIQAMHVSGDPIGVDIRLRPEGRKGHVVVTDEGFKRYEVGPMELWERFALGRSRLVCGRPEALEIVRLAAFGRYVGREDFAALAHMKRRIEKERVSPRERTRHLKLGSGALDDVFWTVQLLLMSQPEVALACPSAETTPRLTALKEAGVIAGDDVLVLERAKEMFARLRSQIALLGYPRDVMPENPDRLQRLADLIGCPDGNEVLRAFGETTTAVRSILEGVLARLVP